MPHSHEIALALHQEEVEQATAAARVGEGSSTAQRPSTRSTASPVGSPPSTREEYEQAAYQDRQQSSPVSVVKERGGAGLVYT